MTATSSNPARECQPGTALPLSERNAIDKLRLEMGDTTDGDGNPISDEAIIFIVGDDGSSDIRISTPNAAYIAGRIVDLWNAQPQGADTREAKPISNPYPHWDGDAGGGP